MGKTKTKSGWGGARKGSGRDPLPAGTKRVNTTVKMMPKAVRTLKREAKKLGTSQGHWIEHKLGFPLIHGAEDD